MSEATCPVCGAVFPPRPEGAGRPRKYCSSPCRNKAARDNVNRTCSAVGCLRPTRAKGLCATHYNQLREPAIRHRKRHVNCVVCGLSIVRRVDNARLGSHCCSIVCRRVRQFGVTVGTGSYSWNQDARKRAARHGATVIEDVDRDDVLSRDQWRCYLCGIDMRDVADPFNPRSATVDHVVPLSLGGEHSLRNVRACCLACNCSKAGRAAPSGWALAGISPDA